MNRKIAERVARTYMRRLNDDGKEAAVDYLEQVLNSVRDEDMEDVTAVINGVLFDILNGTPIRFKENSDE